MIECDINIQAALLRYFTVLYKYQTKEILISNVIKLIEVSVINNLLANL